MRGLPALLRAVPASFSKLWPLGSEDRDALESGSQRGTSSRGHRAETLMELVGALPPDLLERALTHSSWVGERTGSYERLEFLGDSVLGLAIASVLYERYPEREEGGLARLKAFVVSRASCVQVAERMGLAALVLERAPASERKRREAVRSPSMLGDMLEAVIGAAYLHFGFERVRPAIIAVFDEQIEYAVTAHVDHKTSLQELLAPRGLQPHYRLVEETGPAHARVFTSEVLVDGVARGRGVGTTIKMSEQAAAREALADLDARPTAEAALEPGPNDAAQGPVASSEGFNG